MQTTRFCWSRSTFPRRLSVWRSNQKPPWSGRNSERRWRCSSDKTPRFRALESEDTGQTIISGMGELHLEVIKHRLLRDFNLNVKVHKPRVSYKETVKGPAEALGKCQRQVGGAAIRRMPR